MRLICYSLLLVLISSTAIAQPRVVQGSPTVKDLFPKKSGVFRLSDGNVSLGIILKDTLACDTLRLYNSDTIQHKVGVAGTGSSCLKVMAGSEYVQPDSAVWFAVTFDASCHPGYGFVMERFSITTDDPLQPVKPFTVTMKLLERFPIMTSEDSVMVQKARVPVKFLDLGKVKKGIVVTKEFLIYNDGKRDLVVRQVKSDSPAVQVKLSAQTVLPGDSIVLTMELNTAGRSGKESRTFQVYVNDPAQPELRFDIAYSIE